MRVRAWEVAQAVFWTTALGYHAVRSEDGQVEVGPWAWGQPI
jgi:hypothetical protein